MLIETLRRTLTIFVICGGACLGVSASAAIAGGADAAKPPTIVAQASASVEREPDYLDVSVGVVAEAKTASEAQSSANKVMDGALAAIRGLNLAGEDLKTGTVDLSPRYEQRTNYDRAETPKIIGYVATITLRIRTTDLKSSARIIDAALGAGCNRIDGVTFGIKEALEAREEATKLAIKAAKRKAEVMAEALDMRIVSVMEATSSSPSFQPWTANRMMNVQMSYDGGAPAQEVVVPGKIEVAVDSTITFVAAPK